MRLQILNAATETSAAPSPATAGFSLDRGTDLVKHDTANLVVKSTAGSGTMTVTLRLWGYTAIGGWAPLGTGADAAKGLTNEGAALGETGTDAIAHSEQVVGLASFDRIYCQVTAIGGTSTAVSAYLVQHPDVR